MSIIEEQYATEVIAKDGTVYKFDDIGCMIKFLQDEKGSMGERLQQQAVVRLQNSGSCICGDSDTNEIRSWPV